MIILKGLGSTRLITQGYGFLWDWGGNPFAPKVIQMDRTQKSVQMDRTPKAVQVTNPFKVIK